MENKGSKRKGRVEQKSYEKAPETVGRIYNILTFN
jgi:hypothetical protein